MTATDHPEYTFEEQHLEQTLTAVDTWALQLQDLMGFGLGADARTSQILRDMNARDLQMVRYIQSIPYFGRIDFYQGGESKVETFYLGEYGMNRGNTQIISWQAPVARLFYRSTASQTSYQSPTGEIGGRLKLKRRFVVQNRSLQTIHDEIDRRDKQNETTTSRTSFDEPDAFLRTVLSGAADARLRRIVATIQAEQYALIEADATQALVVQGVAGSGKTSVALHRLSYLLYPGNAQNISATHCIVFGPNRMFLNYVSTVLPKLGVDHIAQTTLAQWALDRLGLGGKDVSDIVFDTILATNVPRNRKIEFYRACQLRTSRRMATLLERYIEHRRNQILFPSEGWLIEVGGIRRRLRISQQQLLDKFHSLSSQPLQIQRKQFLRYLQDGIARHYEAQADRDAENYKELRTRELNKLNVQLQKLLDSVWPQLNPRWEYHALLANPDLMRSLSDDLFTPDEISRLATPFLPTAPVKKDTDIDLCDLPAIHYLHLLDSPPEHPLYDHIVIDEAQDISELELLTLRRFFTRNGSFTILGDLPQSIYSHRGITSWSQVGEIFADGRHTYSELQRSYRTTFEIMTVANHILDRIRKIRPNTPHANPFERHGSKPSFHSVSSDLSLVSTIRRALQHARASEFENIAVIAKTVDRCLWLKQALGSTGDHQAPNVALSPSFDYQGGPVILPVYLAKGMEFDVAIVIDADKRTYSETEFDGRLLYVAVTRALHELHIFWIGEPSTFLGI